MLVNLDFVLNCHIKQLQVEAESEAEAVDKLRGMTLDEILANETLSGRDLSVSDISSEVLEYQAVIEVSNIVYDFDDREISQEVIEYLKNILPDKSMITITVPDVLSDNEPEIEDLVKEEISYRTGYDVASLSFRIVEKK